MLIEIPKHKSKFNLSSPRDKNYDKTVVSLTSYLLFTDSYVYKIKRPVKMLYFDFTNLKDRKHYTEVEYSINNKFSEEIYLGINFLVKKEKNIYEVVNKIPKGISDKDIAEYVLKMKRLSSDKSLRNLLISKNTLTSDEIDRVVKKIIHLHKTGKTDSIIKKFGYINTVLFNFQESIGEIGELIDKTDTTIPVNFKKIKETGIKYLHENKKLLQTRADNGYVKHLHGDLRLDQIYIYPKKVHLIDAVESVPRFYYCDVLSDISFLLMELDGLGFNGISDSIEKKYKSTMDSYPDHLLIYYKLYRSLIRIKMNLYKYVDKETPPSDKFLLKARLYINLAMNYTNLL